MESNGWYTDRLLRDAVKTIFLTRQNWDQPDIILHEYGHFINQLLYPAYNAETGCSIAAPQNPPRPACAWQEGFATYLGAMIQGDPSYAGNFNDTSTVDFNLETGIHSVKGRALGADDPGAVTAFLWDIFDRRKETCDSLHSGFNGPNNNGIWRILNDYYPPTVVFFWSGWVLSDNGMDLQVDTLAEHHGFYSETPTCVNSQWDEYYTIFLPYHRLNEPIPGHR